MTSIVMRPATSAANALQSEGLDVKPEVAAQLAASGVAGPGVSGLEEAIRLKIPFVLDPLAFDRANSMARADHQLHRALMIERAKKHLRRVQAKAGPEEQLDDLTLDFKAQTIVTHVRDHIALHGLTVDTQRLAFDPAYPFEVKQRILRGMAQADFGPTTATAAAAAGHLPPLPISSVADAIHYLARQERIIGLGGSLPGWIAKHKPYLVEFPLPNLGAGRLARADSFRPAPLSAELGLGFILVAQEEFRSQYHVITPMLFARRSGPRPDDPIVYRAECQTQLYPLSKVQFIDMNRTHNELTLVLRDRQRNRVFRLDTCSQCGAVTANGHPELEHRNCSTSQEK